MGPIVKIKSGHTSSFSTSGTTYLRVDSEVDRELPRMLAPFRRSFDRNLRGCVRNRVSGPNIASLRNKVSTETFHIIRKLLSSEVLSLSRSYLHLLDLMHFQVNSHIIPILSSPLASEIQPTQPSPQFLGYSPFFIFTWMAYFFINILDICCSGKNTSIIPKC